MTLSDVQVNSGTWGNYTDSTGGASTGRGTLQVTGYNEYWKSNNIYDMAGNTWEWTQEKYSTGTYRSIRGGIFDISSSTRPVAHRFDRYYDCSVEGIRIPY